MSVIDIHGTRVIDLTQRIETDIPVPVGFPGPVFETYLSQEKGDVANVEILWMGMHAGTHCDAPYHFFSDLPTIDELPPEIFIGPAIVVDVSHLEGAVQIEYEDFKNWELKSGETIQPGDGVLLFTGNSKNWGLGKEASKYWENGWPYLSPSAVEYLSSKPIRWIGVESFDPDWVDLNDLSTATFPTHRGFLPKGIYIIENLTNLDKIPKIRCSVIALPLKIKQGSGSPLRVIAIV